MNENDVKIAVAGIGYVGLSIAVLLASHNRVAAVDIVPEKIQAINNRVSPIKDPIYMVLSRNVVLNH